MKHVSLTRKSNTRFGLKENRGVSPLKLHQQRDDLHYHVSKLFTGLSLSWNKGTGHAHTFSGLGRHALDMLAHPLQSEIFDLARSSGLNVYLLKQKLNIDAAEAKRGAFKSDPETSYNAAEAKRGMKKASEKLHKGQINDLRFIRGQKTKIDQLFCKAQAIGACDKDEVKGIRAHFGSNLERLSQEGNLAAISSFYSDKIEKLTKIIKEQEMDHAQHEIEDVEQNSLRNLNDRVNQTIYKVASQHVNTILKNDTTAQYKAKQALILLLANSVQYHDEGHRDPRARWNQKRMEDVLTSPLFGFTKQKILEIKLQLSNLLESEIREPLEQKRQKRMADFIENLTDHPTSEQVSEESSVNMHNDDISHAQYNNTHTSDDAQAHNLPPIEEATSREIQITRF